MKKIVKFIVGGMVVVMITGVAVYNVSLNSLKSVSNSILLANIEALSYESYQNRQDETVAIGYISAAKVTSTGQIPPTTIPCCMPSPFTTDGCNVTVLGCIVE